MNHPAGHYAINSQYILVTALAVPATWLLHEGTHWAAGTALGYDMALTLNTGYAVNGLYDNDRHYQLISAAGPLVTLLEALVVFIFMRRRKKYLLYPFLVTCFYMRLLAGLLSFVNPNDEARISEALGIGRFTLPVLMTALLLVLVYKTSRRYRFRTRFNATTIALVILFSSIIILSDQFFHIRLL